MVKAPLEQRLYLTPLEAAEVLMASKASIRLWVSKGILPAQPTSGSHRRFLRRDIKIFARERGIAIAPREESALKLLIVDDDNVLSNRIAGV